MKKNDIDNLTQRYLLYKNFFAWSCNGSSVAPLTDYINKTKNDERVYLDLRASSGRKTRQKN